MTNLMSKVTRIDNDPKSYLTVTEYNYRENYLDMALIVHQYIQRDGKILWMWTVLKNYPNVELRLVWAFQSYRTFAEAIAEGRKALLERIDHLEVFGITHEISDCYRRKD